MLLDVDWLPETLVHDNNIVLACSLCRSYMELGWLHPVNIQNEPVHEISNNVVCATIKASDQPAHRRSLIRAFASRLSIK